jgi:hypothetical protein
MDIRCSGPCAEVLPETEFYRNDSLLGRETVCKLCQCQRFHKQEIAAREAAIDARRLRGLR